MGGSGALMGGRFLRGLGFRGGVSFGGRPGGMMTPHYPAVPKSARSNALREENGRVAPIDAGHT
jgi:hypothetical protein